MYLHQALGFFAIYSLFCTNQLAFAEQSVNAFRTNGDESFTDEVTVVNNFHNPDSGGDDDVSVTNDVEMLAPNNYLHATDFIDSNSGSMTNGNVSLANRSGKLYQYDDFMGSLDFPEPNNYDYGELI